MAQRRSFNREFLVICVTKEYPLMVAKSNHEEKYHRQFKPSISRCNC